MTKAQASRFKRRTTQLMADQRRRLREYLGDKSADLPFELEELRAKVKVVLGMPCTYCNDKLTASNISADHRCPISRADFPAHLKRVDDRQFWGNLAFSIMNIDIICKRCNRRKGELTNVEFEMLIDLVSTMPTAASTYIMKKLGARLPYYGKDRAQKMAEVSA